MACSCLPSLTDHHIDDAESVPRAVASGSLSIGLLIGTRSLPLAALIRRCQCDDLSERVGKNMPYFMRDIAHEIWRVSSGLQVDQNGEFHPALGFAHIQ